MRKHRIWNKRTEVMKYVNLAEETTNYNTDQYVVMESTCQYDSEDKEIFIGDIFLEEGHFGLVYWDDDKKDYGIDWGYMKDNLSDYHVDALYVVGNEFESPLLHPDKTL